MLGDISSAPDFFDMYIARRRAQRGAQDPPEDPAEALAKTIRASSIYHRGPSRGT